MLWLPGRSLGITYKFFNQKVLADQGIFAENKYNDQISGFQGFSLSGRWLYKVINDDYMTLHVGLGIALLPDKYRTGSR